MSLNDSTRGVRLAIEPLEDRCTPSAWMGDHPAFGHGHHGNHHAPAAHVAHHHHNAVPITLSAHVTSDGSGGLRLSGTSNLLGHWTGIGTVDSVSDPIEGSISITGSITLVAANGDKLFASFSGSLDIATKQLTESLTFTGGTGRFAGASGYASLHCESNWDPATPLVFECTGTGTGALTFAHGSW